MTESDDGEIWFERVAGGTFMPVSTKGFLITAKYILIGCLFGGGLGAIAFALLGKEAAIAAGALVALLCVVRYSAVANKHSR